MPFEDLTGNSGFTSDSEGASLNLNVNMSEDAARNLWDVQAAVQQIAADFQTAVRAASDFQSYLISMRETAQTLKMPSLNMEGGESGNLAYAGGRVDTGSVPLIQSEQGMAGRIGEMEENSEGISGGALAAAGAARALTGKAIDPGAFVGNLTQAAFLASASGQNQHGIPQATGGAYQRAYQYAQNNPLDPAVQGAIHMGQQGTPHAFAASQIISQGLPAARQFLSGGGAGGFASILGRLGTVGAVGYGVYQLANAGLETYAQSRSLGIATNNSDHGAAWGFGTRLSQAGMAMSPFVSQEEAAQIYSTAVEQGWASRRGGFEAGTFGQAVNFMYGAAKNYNMDPAMSGQLLQTNVIGAGESVVALNEQLLTLKQTLDGTGVSMDAASSTFTNFTGMLIASGATGPQAAQIAGGALSAYSSNPYLRNGRGAEIVQQTMGTQQTQNILAALTGTLPGAALAGEGHLAKSTAELDRLTKRFTDQVMSMTNLDEAEKGAMFAQIYNSTFGTNITTQDALNMMAVNASNPNALSEGQKEYAKNQGMSYNSSANGKDKGAWDRYLGGIQDQASGAWYKKFSYATSWLTSAPNLFDPNAGDSENSVRNYSPEVQTLLDSSADPSKVTVVDESGKVVATGRDAVSKWFSNPANFQKFAVGGSKYTLKDDQTSYTAAQLGGAGNTGDTGTANDTNTVYIKLSSDAQRWFATNKSSLNLSDGKVHQ